ncbi:hypothetical protein F4778DRAFT_778266 [Xylariomycetidae sp. FL2044]|nr:hypothetical protein F4778DRAFT_778266 [Xylariomycetidae sp. FL2044]
MAAAALMNPTPAYPPHAPTFSPTYHHQPPPPPPPPPPPTQPSMGSMMPHAEGGRLSSEMESTAQRPPHTLPSIQEVFSAPAPKPRPYSPTTPTTMAGPPQNLPPPFSNNLTPRPETATEQRPTPSHEERFMRYPHPSEVGPPGPPTSFPFPEQREASKPPESMPNGRGPNPPPPSHIPYPQGQYPLPGGPISPRHMPPPYPGYEPPRHSHSDEDYGMQRTRYDSATLNRHYEAWNYQENLNKMVWWTKTLSNFAEAWSKSASEQHGGPPIPERMPTERECTDMLGNLKYIQNSIENVREYVQHTGKAAREADRSKGPYDGDDDIMYSDKSFSLGEVKKRRGRAAPPGRCHSCNRIDTPEWRRGPDGARTLCNACGLHYAKLERKRQMEQRSIRPKGMDDRL